jgi:hypothetical protein
LPVDLRLLVTGHDVATVEYCGWKGTKNGRLLALAAGDGFEAMVTSDTSIEKQQNPATLPIAVVILHPRSNDLPDITPLVPRLIKALASLRPKTFTHVY